MRLIQISDCHLRANPEARSRLGFPLHQLESVIAHAASLRPDILLVTGDVSQDESPASYRLAAGAFDSVGCPWFWFAGNHDHPDFMQELRPFHSELDLGDWRLLCLDSRVPGQAGGELGRDQLAELALSLELSLEQDPRPILLAMHHHPLPIGSTWMDELGLADRDVFWETLSAYPQVKAVLCGHIHQAFASEQGNVAVYGVPSTSDQFAPLSHDFVVDEAARPGFRVVDLDSERLETWVERVNL
ncbi:metallophosphoesterase family protein [Cobetia crustatorum]|uniref:metallophosphoesterase family protein n=1 Tax=Cobetia crustatorum TaxID=553385 RepID=UPI000469B6CC|nr:metallophosphoesterase [Cobetia crustatorum]